MDLKPKITAIGEVRGVAARQPNDPIEEALSVAEVDPLIPAGPLLLPPHSVEPKSVQAVN